MRHRVVEGNEGSGIDCAGPGYDNSLIVEGSMVIHETGVTLTLVQC